MEEIAVVVDPGTDSIKAGFAGQEHPSIEMPSIVGHPRFKPKYQNLKSDGIFIGNDADFKRGILQIKYPIEHGFVSNWDDLERLMKFVLIDTLSILPEEHPVLVIDPPINPKLKREKMTQMMFETFNVPKFQLQNSAVSTLQAYTMDTGLVVELGHGAFRLSPVYNGSLMKDITPRVPWSGVNITELLREQLLENKSMASIDALDHFKSEYCYQTLRGIKHKCCFVSQNFKSDMQKSSDNEDITCSYELPDGNVITLDKERFIPSECIFDPYFLEMQGLHETIYHTIMRTNEDMQKKLFSNIVLSGGSSLLPGLTERMKTELETLNKNTLTVHVVARENRKNSAWIGGSKMASMESSGDRWITKEEYDEEGPILVHKRCI